MKKSMILTAALLAVMFAPLWAQEFEVMQNADGGVTIKGFSRPWSGSELVIPSTLYGLKVTAIGDYAFGFYNDRIGKFTSVVIPDTVTSIGKSAFEGHGLKNVTMGKGVRIIGESAFSSELFGGRNFLGKINLPNSVIEIGESAFWGTLITEIIIPAGVRKIGINAFKGGNEITTVVIPASLSPGTNGQLGGYFSAFNGDFYEGNISSNFFITLPAGMDTGIVKANFGESLGNYYASQGKTAGTYVKNGPVWTKRQSTAQPQQQSQPQARPTTQSSFPMTGLWKVTGRDSKNWVGDLVIEEIDGETFSGRFDWYYSPGTEFVGREYFRGTYNSRTKAVQMKGYRVTDPGRLGLGTYEAYLSSNGRDFEKGTWTGGTWQAKWHN